MRKTIKTLCIVALTLITVQSNAQIEKGKWITSLGISYNSANSNKTFNEAKSKNSNFSSSLEIGNFISKKVQIGAGFSPFSFKRREDFTADSYYDEKRTGYDLYMFLQFFHKVVGKVSYSPVFKINYYKTESDFKQKQLGFQEVGSVTTSNNYGLQLQPLQFT